MVLKESVDTTVGTLANNFNLLSVDEKKYSLDFFKNGKCYLIMFICNHCPYVVSKIKLITDTVTVLKKEFNGQAIAIMSNDAQAYPDDSYENMKIFAKNNEFCFPYVIDDKQAVAKKYNVQCTPEFFLLDSNLLIQYHGRLCDQTENIKVEDTDLYKAMLLISENKKIQDQKPSMGCSLKWLPS